MSTVKLTSKEIEKLASLSKIKLSKDEVAQFTKDMDTILSSVETLEDFESVTGCKISECAFNEIDFDELREDEIEPSMPKNEVLANAPLQENGYFKINGKTVEGDNS